MIIIWIIYFALSFGISFFISKLVKKRFLKILIFSISIVILSSFWFKSPGEEMMVPSFTIFLLESTILEGNGFIRILRPMGFITLLVIIISSFLWKKNTKN
jgi:hypothetical protein